MVATPRVVHRFVVKVNGAAVPGSVADLLVTATVDTSLNLPDLVVLEFSDPGSTVLAAGGFTVGVALAVQVHSAGEGGAVDLFVGEVTGVETEFDGTSLRTVVRAYDASHRLHRGRTTRAYLKASYSDVVKQVARRTGVKVGTVDTTGEVHEHVTQANQEDWAFLRRLAADVGFDLTVEAGKLHFRNPVKANGAPAASRLDSENPLELFVGDEGVLRLRVSMTSAEQVGTTSARGWDYTAKQAVSAEAPAPAPASAALATTPAQLSARFGSPSYRVASAPLRTSQSATAVARATAARIAGSFAEVEAEVLGNPRLKPGVAVGIGGVGPALSGRYTISGARHVFDSELGYRTVVLVSDRQDRSILGLVTGGAPGGGNRVHGVVPAIVTNNNDTERGLGRVKVKFPWLDDSYESPWARVVQPGAGPDRGFQVLPEVNDEVLVAFEQGDVERPYVLGGVHNGKDKPKAKAADLVKANKVNQRLFTSRTGHQLVFLDEPGKKGTITLITGTGQTTLVLGGTSAGLTIDTTDDVKVTTKGAAVIDAARDVTVTTKARAVVEAGGSVDVTAKGKATLKAAAVTVQADSVLELKGAVVKIEAQGVLEAKGALVKIN